MIFIRLDTLMHHSWYKRQNALNFPLIYTTIPIFPYPTAPLSPSLHLQIRRL
jgi:hypothetical protein